MLTIVFAPGIDLAIICSRIEHIGEDDRIGDGSWIVPEQMAIARADHICR
jgi:hypothetical protein